jgi:16S rRNA (cytidine1402-2'-O)-methyltransferase
MMDRMKKKAATSGEPLATDETIRSTPERKSPGAMLTPGLYIAATPIGNARDITLRTLDALAGADLILAEDTRVTAKLLAIHGIRGALASYNDHNAQRERPKILARLAKGDRIVLVSDAGTPLVSDPGFKLVRDAIAAGVAVHPLPGASALLAGLVASGLPTDKFHFAGFPPPRSGERRTMLESVKAVEATLIFFEATQRLAESLADMHAVLGARQAVVARELTKLHEELRRGDLAALAHHYRQAGKPLGEVTIVVAGPVSAGFDEERASELLKQALAFMPVRAAVDLIGNVLDAPRRSLYELALKMKSDE